MSTKSFRTEQENFWAGEFGNNYILRNTGEQRVAGNIALFSKILANASTVRSVLEFGSNIGLNLRAIRALLPNLQRLSALEINDQAVEALRTIDDLEVYHTSILEFSPPATWDLVFTKGVLIHINPDELPSVYDKLYAASSRYLCVAEYYNPVPTEIPYRGHVGYLFKRDFAGEILDRFPDLRLVSYGFAYHRDPAFPQDDLTWFLLEKATPSDLSADA